MRRSLLLVVLMASFAMGANFDPFASYLVFEDSLRLDSTESKFMKVVYQDNGGNKTIVFEARDDSSAGFTSDSAAAKIEVFQVFPIAKLGQNKMGGAPYFLRLKSHAHPDSSTYPFGSQFVLFDSLEAKTMMDSAAVYARDIESDTTAIWRVSKSYGDSLKTLQTSGFGAFTYSSVPFDYSPGFVLKFTGKASNKGTGVGSIWKVRVYQLAGTSVRTKG